MDKDTEDIKDRKTDDLFVNTQRGTTNQQREDRKEKGAPDWEKSL